MNNERRKSILESKEYLETVAREIADKAADEETGNLPKPEVRLAQIKSWQDKVFGAMHDLESDRDEERATGRTADSAQAVDQLDQAVNALEEMAESEPEMFLAHWHENISNIIANLESAAA